MTALELLTAREEIKELRARYFRFVDSHDWPAFEALFVEKAVLDLTDDVGRLLRGREEIAQYVSAGLADVVSVHHGHMPEIVIESALRATGVWASDGRPAVLVRRVHVARA